MLAVLAHDQRLSTQDKSRLGATTAVLPSDAAGEALPSSPEPAAALRSGAEGSKLRPAGAAGSLDCRSWASRSTDKYACARKDLLGLGLAVHLPCRAECCSSSLAQRPLVASSLL